jgi:Ca-activated chloride channel family protein
MPWVLSLWVLVAVILLMELRTKAPGHIIVSTGNILAGIGAGAVNWLRHLPAFLRAAGLALLVVALAGPLHGFQVRKDRENIVDIVLCVDVSESMNEMDFIVNGQRATRLDVTKAAVQDFIDSRKIASEDRYGVDRLGIVLYAGIAWTACPLTLDYGILEHELEQAHVEDGRLQPEKQGTAIGSALGLAVQRLKDTESKSKVIVLLTDGLNNRGELDPITAAEIAKSYGIRIYTIGAGALNPRRTLLSASRPIDEESLKRIAETTGGKYYQATDLDSLRQAYAEIDELERTEIEIGEYYEYKEAFMPWLLAGGILAIASIFSRRVWFEVLP